MNDREASATYAHATAHAGVIDLSEWNTLRVIGADRAAFLHNMCTNHIRDLAAGGGCEAFFTDVKGKVVAHAIVLAGDDEILLLLSPGQIERLLPHLDRYIIRENVQLADATPEHQWMLLVGPQTPALVDSLAAGAVDLPETDWSHAVLPIGGTAVRAVRCNLPWCGGVLLAVERARADVVHAVLQEHGAATCTESDWHTIRIESFWPLFGVDFDGSNLAQECGRDAEAIHLRKGCYLGQETIARIDALGHVNKRLMEVRIDGEPPAAGANVTAGGQAIGHVTSACWSPRSGAALGIAMLRQRTGDGYTDVSCDGRPATIRSSR